MTAKYRVRARTTSGRLIDERIEADSDAEVFEALRARSLTPISVEAPRAGSLLTLQIGRGRVKLKHIALFARQFATLQESGVSILRSLQILADQSESPALRAILREVKTEVEQGTSLSEALALHDEFPPLLVNMVRAGEAGGFLDTTLNEVAKALESEVKLRSKILAAITYPVALFAISIVIAIVMLIFVVPVFENMFRSLGGSELPVMTRILVTLSEYMKFLLPLGLVAGIAMFVLWSRYRNTPQFRGFVDPIRMRLPIVGRLSRKIALARFSRTLAMLTGTGVPMLQALDIVAQTSGNAMLAAAIIRVRDAVKSGETIAEPMASEPLFPPMVTQMVLVGEESGSLDRLLGKVADFYETEVEAQTEQMMSLIEPLMILVLGSVIALMVISLYLPIFSVYDQLGQIGNS